MNVSLPHWFRRIRVSRQALWVHTFAALTALMGLVNLFSSVLPTFPERWRWLSQYSPLEVLHGARLAAALAGFVLLALAAGLNRRKRAAWVVTLAILIFSSASHLLKGLDFTEAALALALAGALFASRPLFHARSDPPSVRQGLRMLALAAVFTLVYGVAGFYLLDKHFAQPFNLSRAFAQTVAMFTTFTPPDPLPVTGLGRFFSDSVYTVSIVTVAFSLFLALRPVLVRRPATPAEREKARALIAAHAETPLAPLALLKDKSYFFSPGGSVIAFVQQQRVALVLGEPTGPAEDFEPAATAFIEHCARQDWQPAFFQIRPPRMAFFQSKGFDLLAIGEEAAVDLSAFTLEGGPNKPLRNAFNKVQRAGYQAHVLQPPHAPALLADLRLISDEWLTQMHGSEMKFSIGWFDEDYLQTGPLLVVGDAQGQPVAFANLLIEPAKREITIDLMRRRAAVENGVMDFMFVSLLQWGQGAGYASFNFGVSPLAGVGQSHSDPALERAMHTIYENVHQFYNFKGLHAYKDKFHPAWEQRYLAYPGPLALPAVALALIRAHR